MGRWSTGALTTGEVCRIELSYLLRQGMILKGQRLTSSLSWTNDSNIIVISCYTDSEKYIRLSYVLTSWDDNRKHNYDYKIQLASVPSNLGRGEVLYFICPESNKRCRVLYRCYGSHKWKSREAYNKRIYYTGQNSSKFFYSTDRYFELKKQLEKLEQLSTKDHYQGKATKLQKRIKRLKGKMMLHDQIRWELVEKRFNVWDQMLYADMGRDT